MTRAIERRLRSEEDYRSIFEAASDGLVIYDMETDRVIEANPTACEMHGYTYDEFIGLNPRVFMPPESHVLFQEHTRTAKTGGSSKSQVTHLRKDRSPFHVEVNRSAITYQGRLCLLSVIRDVSERVKTEKTLRGQIEARLREQATLLSISHTLASTLEFQPALILDQLREIVEYAHGGLFLLEDSTLVSVAMRGTPGLEHLAPLRIHLQGPETVAALFDEHRPICIANVWNKNPQAQFLRSLLDGEAAPLLEGMQSWMWVPLAVKNRALGGIGVTHSKPNYFTRHRARLALSVANQAAITKFNAELYEHAQALAVLEERQRLAQNLHDAVNQLLFSAGLIAEVLPRLLERDPQEARRSLEDLRSLTRGAVAEMRAVLVELRPSSLTDTNLGDLMHLLGNAFTGRTNIPVKVTVVGGGVLPADVQGVIYHICQAALNKAAKHVGASQVEIYLEHEDTGVELRIRDDGQDVDSGPHSSASNSDELSRTRQQAIAVGAVLSYTRQPGCGTELLVHWHKSSKKEAL